MRNLETVIRGALYEHMDLDMLLEPHFSGQVCMVDCTRYVLEDEYEKMFDKKPDEDCYYREENDKKYYFAETTQCGPEKMNLLSDISDLTFIE